MGTSAVVAELPVSGEVDVDLDEPGGDDKVRVPMIAAGLCHTGDPFATADTAGDHPCCRRHEGARHRRPPLAARWPSPMSSEPAGRPSGPTPQRHRRESAKPAVRSRALSVRPPTEPAHHDPQGEGSPRGTDIFIGADTPAIDRRGA